MAQKDALQKRISALEDGLRVSSELVEIPVTDIEQEVDQVNEKLEIAQERLESLEQEEYLEDLGRKLNRSHSEHNETSEEMDDADSDSEESFLFTRHPTPFYFLRKGGIRALTLNKSLCHARSYEPRVVYKLMNRRVRKPHPPESVVQPEKETSAEETLSVEPQANALSLEETAEKLGVEAEFLREKVCRRCCE